jgi:S-adenosylmethionine:tRNA ribosyltransferase-isomerase
MVVDAARATLRTGRIDGLAETLESGDTLVVNDAATLPASLGGYVAGTGAAIEARLLPFVDPSLPIQAVLLGAGRWSERTEDRAAPPAVAVGERLRFPPSLESTVTEVSAISPRLVTLDFGARDRATFWRELYLAGKPIQYSYLAGDLRLWSAQTAYASRPWASEMPSAGKPLSATLLLALRRKGVRIAALTHATGISSSGDPEIDRRLPFPEFYEIPDETAEAVNRSLALGRRVIAVGTSVVRALESQAGAARGFVAAGSGRTELLISERHSRRIVSGILTGIHEEGESHFELLASFAPRPLLVAALRSCRENGFLSHEFGDSALILSR